MTLYKTLSGGGGGGGRDKYYLPLRSPVFLRKYRISIFLIDIDAALLECWIMQSWDFDTLPYAEKEKSKNI